MSIRLGICGVGAFADCFIPLFKHHPEVENVILCDLNAEKLTAKCAKFDIADRCASLDELCELDVEAIAVITQHHLHGPQGVQALRAGKHVYSAVPSAISMEEITELIEVRPAIRTTAARRIMYTWCRNLQKGGPPSNRAKPISH